VVLVISAMGKETDELLRLAHDVSDVRPGREMDMLITAGERKAVALMSMALAAVGVESESYTGSQAGFLTDTNHTNAKILEVRAERIREAVAAGRVPVVAGSQGMSTDGTSPSSAAVDPTPPPSRSPTRSTRTPASSTPTSPACSPPIPGSCRPPARCTASPSTRCSR
jgi:aspartokinase